jgi:hypothetical protein
MTALSRLPGLRRLADAPDFSPRLALPWLTILMLLLNAPETWFLRTPLVVLFALAMVFRRWVYSAPFWYCVATLLGASVYLNWATSDNHKYLFVYWALALCCAFSLPRDEQDAALAATSRWLIGLCMLWATLWKLANPQYLDGGFFQYELLIDERFSHFTNWLAGVPLADLAKNRELRELLVSGHLDGLEINRVVLSGGSRVASLALLLTWWTVAIEGLLAVLFLLPARWLPSWCRNGLLIAFAVTTYSVAPVRGFGWLLMLLGMAQCGREERGFRYAYLGAFLLIQAYTMPLGSLVELLRGP